MSLIVNVDGVKRSAPVFIVVYKCPKCEERAELNPYLGVPMCDKDKVFLDPVMILRPQVAREPVLPQRVVQLREWKAQNANLG